MNEAWNDTRVEYNPPNENQTPRTDDIPPSPLK